MALEVGSSGWGFFTFALLSGFLKRLVGAYKGFLWRLREWKKENNRRNTFPTGSKIYWSREKFLEDWSKWLLDYEILVIF